VKEERDEVLVRRVLAGETQVYAGLVARYRDRLGRYAIRMLGNHADAEDVLQDTFVRAYRSLARCEAERFGNWLFGILINRCRTYAAQRAKRQSIIVNDDFVVGEVAAAETGDSGEWQRTVAWALEQLPLEQREAFLLKHVEDLSYEEMQDVTGARVPALKMRVLRAREALRRILQEKVLD
jgi:RNA polymerase sigma-70 factor (ECF subfamily)